MILAILILAFPGRMFRPCDSCPDCVVAAVAVESRTALLVAEADLDPDTIWRPGATVYALAEWDFLRACTTGPGVEAFTPCVWAGFDADLDGDCDLRDVMAIARD